MGFVETIKEIVATPVAESKPEATRRLSQVLSQSGVIAPFKS